MKISEILIRLFCSAGLVMFTIILAYSTLEHLGGMSIVNSRSYKEDIERIEKDIEALQENVEILQKHRDILLGLQEKLVKVMKTQNSDIEILRNHTHIYSNGRAKYE